MYSLLTWLLAWQVQHDHCFHGRDKHHMLTTRASSNCARSGAQSYTSSPIVSCISLCSWLASCALLSPPCTRFVSLLCIFSQKTGHPLVMFSGVTGCPPMQEYPACVKLALPPAIRQPSSCCDVVITRYTKLCFLLLTVHTFDGALIVLS